MTEIAIFIMNISSIAVLFYLSSEGYLYGFKSPGFKPPIELDNICLTLTYLVYWAICAVSSSLLKGGAVAVEMEQMDNTFAI